MNASSLIHHAWNRERCGEAAEMDAAEGISDALENALFPRLALLTYFLLSSSLYLSLPSRVSRISIQTTVLHLLSFLPRAVPRIPESQLRKKGRKKEKSGERGRGRAFQRVFRMKSRPNEVRKLPNGEASSLLLVGSKWRGKKCRLAVAFVATGE